MTLVKWNLVSVRLDLVLVLVQDTMVSAPVVIPPVATMNENEEPVLQDPIEPIATHEREQQQPQTEDVPNVEAPSRSQKS